MLEFHLRSHECIQERLILLDGDVHNRTLHDVASKYVWVR